MKERHEREVFSGDMRGGIRDDLDGLPDIPPVPLEIVEAVNQGRLAIFIGAGASCIMGYPDWPTLAEMVIDACRSYVRLNYWEELVPPKLWAKCTQLAKEEPKKALTVCHQLFKDHDHEQAFFECAAGCLRSPLRHYSPDNIGDIYKEIYGLRGFFLTTNMDPEFDQRFRDKNQFRIPEDPTLVDRAMLYHLHGTVMLPETMVLTTQQYLNCYRDPSTIRFLEWVFAKNVVLFIGYGLHEYEVLDYLIMRMDSRSSQPNQKFFLLDYNRDTSRDPDLDRLYYRSLGVTLVPYASVSEHETSLIRVLLAWRKEIDYRSEFLFQTTIDLAQAAASYDESKADRILQMITEANFRDNFFTHLKTSADPVAWFKRLDQEGFLEPPTWVAFTYLEKVAIQNEKTPSDDITSLIINYIDAGIKRQKSKTARIEQQSIDELILKILFHLPNEKDVSDRCEFLHFALEEGDDMMTITVAIIDDILPSVLEREWKEILLSIFDVVFDVGDREAKEEAISPFIQEYYLNKICLDFAEPAATLCGQGLTTAIREKIKTCAIDNPQYYHYGRRVRSLTESSGAQAPHTQADILVRFFVEVAISLSTRDLNQIITELQTEDDIIFHRIALALIDARFGELHQFLTVWPKNPFNDHLLEHELYHLLGAHATAFNKQEMDVLVEWIDSSDLGKNIDEKGREGVLAYYRKRWYQALEQSGHPRVREGLHISSSLCPDPIQVDQEEEATLTLIEPTEDDLQQLRGLSMTEVARVLIDLFGASQEFHPMRADMEDVLRRSVSEDPSRYSGDLDPFVNLSARIHYGLLWGFDDAWKNKRAFSWEAVLTFIETILVTEPYKVLEPDSSSSIQSWVIGTIGSLLQSAVQSDDRAMDTHLLPRAYTLLRSSIFRTPEAPESEGDDRINQTLNTSQGRLLQAFISLALHAERIKSDDLQTIGVSALLSDLHTLLFDSSRISMNYLTVIGWYYSTFYYYNQDWITKHHSTIFPRDCPPQWEASMTGLLFRANTVSRDIFVHLKESGEFIHAISFEITDHQAAIQLPLLICRGYNSGLDPIEAKDSLIRTLVLTGTPEHLRQIHWFYDRRIGKGIDESERERIRAIWRLVMERFTEGDEEFRHQIVAYSSWLSLFDRIDDEIAEWMLTIADNFRGGWIAEPGLLNALRQHVDHDPARVGAILMRVLENSKPWLNVYKEKLSSIVERLYELEKEKHERENWADQICNFFLSQNEQFLLDLYIANHPELPSDT